MNCTILFFCSYGSVNFSVVPICALLSLAAPMQLLGHVRRTQHESCMVCCVVWQGPYYSIYFNYRNLYNTHTYFKELLTVIGTSRLAVLIFKGPVCSYFTLPVVCGVPVYRYSNTNTTHNIQNKRRLYNTAVRNFSWSTDILYIITRTACQYYSTCINS